VITHATASADNSRTTMKRSTGLKRTPLRKVSKKRAKQNREYSKINRVVYLESHPTCQVCDKRSACDIHHKDKRSGDRLNDITMFLAVCRPCHQWIHDYPADARKQGFLV